MLKAILKLCASFQIANVGIKINYKILVKQSSDLNEQSLDLFSKIYLILVLIFYQKIKIKTEAFNVSLSKKSNILL
jgi:hypothetical protein